MSAAALKLGLAEFGNCPGTLAFARRGARAAEALSRLSISFFAIFGALLSAAAIGDGRPASASVLLTFLGAAQGLLRP